MLAIPDTPGLGINWLVAVKRFTRGEQLVVAVIPGCRSATAWTRVERRLAGALRPSAPQRAHELTGALIYVFTALLFIPVLMRRLGDTAEELALFSGGLSE
jgi:hypothetical protein